jgi:hypothetical protein
MFHLTSSDGEHDQQNQKAVTKVGQLFKLFQQQQQQMKEPTDTEQNNVNNELDKLQVELNDEQVMDMRPYLILTCLLYSDAKLSLLQTLIFKVIQIL